MNSKFKIENTDNIAVTISFTATIYEWKSIKSELKGDKIPAVSFGNRIKKAIDQVEQHIEVSE